MAERDLKLNRRDFLKAGAGLLTAAILSGCGGSAQPHPVSGMIDGFNYTSWAKGEYSGAKSDESLKNLAETGANALALVVTAFQESIDSTDILLDLPQTVPNEDLSHAISTAHHFGLEVMLKPQINLTIPEDSNNWRGTIGKSFDDIRWNSWFDSYRNFILKYAGFARDQKVERFCTGTELSESGGQEDHWREINAEVRGLFPGSLTYAASFGDYQSINWWDGLDLIGVNGYFSLTDKNDPRPDELVSAWSSKGYVNSLKKVAGKFNKKVIFTEIGYRSIRGANKSPWDSQISAPSDQTEQANCYRAVKQVFLDKPWFGGIYWWAWEVDPKRGGPGDTGYTPFDKLASKEIQLR